VIHVVRRDYFENEGTLVFGRSMRRRRRRWSRRRRRSVTLKEKRGTEWCAG